MMPESEFISLSKGGELEEMKKNSKQKREKQRNNQPAIVELKTVLPLEPNKNKKKRTIRFDITGECEPMSSKVKVEDLVTDGDKEPEPPKRHRALWDRPVPPPNLQWISDPRLPKELNEVNAVMWDYKWPHLAPSSEDY
jgi:hypothetical protein